jgi:energy-coupling factor transporter transmembrane protein EcfT
MTPWLVLLGAQLLIAFSIGFESLPLLVPLALLPVLVLAPAQFRILLRWKLLLFLALIVGGVPLLLGERTALFAGVRYDPEYVRIGAVMAARAIVILLALRLFTSRISLEQLAAALARTRFRQFGEAFGLGMELLPQVRAAAAECYTQYRRAMPRRRVIRHTLSWTVELMASVVVRAETYYYEKGGT